MKKVLLILIISVLFTSCVGFPASVGEDDINCDKNNYVVVIDSCEYLN